MMLFKEELKKLEKDLEKVAPLVAKFLELYWDYTQSALGIEILRGKEKKRYWITRYTSSIEEAKKRWEIVSRIARRERVYHADWLTAQLANRGIRGITILPWHGFNPILEIEFPNPQTAKEIIKAFENLQKK